MATYRFFDCTLPFLEKSLFSAQKVLLLWQSRSEEAFFETADPQERLTVMLCLKRFLNIV